MFGKIFSCYSCCFEIESLVAQIGQQLAEAEDDLKLLILFCLWSTGIIDLYHQPGLYSAEG